MISFFFSFCFCWLRYCTYYGTFGSWYGTFLLKGSYFCWMATRRTRRAIFGRISVISGKCNRWRGYYLWPFEKALEVFFFQCKECSGYQSSSTVNTLCQRSKLFFTRAPHVVNRSFIVLTTQEDHVPEMLHTPCVRSRLFLTVRVEKTISTRLNVDLFTERGKMDVE